MEKFGSVKTSSGVPVESSLANARRAEILKDGTKIQTASVIVGTEACNARCRFCISAMTPEHGITRKRPDIDWHRFNEFLKYATVGQAESIMFTGKGEPTIFEADITDYLTVTSEYEDTSGFKFASIELQTNGLLFADKPDKFDPLLEKWKELGLTTIAISIVHYEPEENKKEYTPNRHEYIDLSRLCEQIHRAGIKVRLSCTLLDGYIDSADKLEELINFARANRVEELTIRPVNKPDDSESRNTSVSDFVEEWFLKDHQLEAMKLYLDINGEEVGRLAHGAIIYDVNGQNVCLSNCLTADEVGYSRQLISYPEGMITDGWTSDAEVLP